MSQRIWIVLLTVFCGVATLAPPATAQDAPKGIKVTFKAVHPGSNLPKGMLTVANKDPYEKRTQIVIKMAKDLTVLVDLDAVDEIVFDQKDKKDTIILMDKEKHIGEIASMFEIRQAPITYIYSRADLVNIRHDREEKAKENAKSEKKAPPASELTDEPLSPVHVSAKFPPIFPFWDLPKVTVISGSYSECCKLPKQCTLEECARKENLFTWAYRFKGAVHFPQPRFDDAGCRFDAPGTAIYEGMQIVVASDGRYEVAFNATTPRIPVTLRLQLSVCVVGHEPIIVSLPAISMTPEYRDAESDYGGGNRVLSNNFQQNWHVRHVGFSPELASAVCLPGCQVMVQRDGVARFGSLPLSR